jgi:hypothetical protein
VKYWAYLSYAHDDDFWARRVHRTIETFRVPRQLRGQTVAGQEVGARLRPLFRDREELASSGDLRASLEEALMNSSALIVLCSPAAAKSSWVDKEVKAFVAKNGKRRVFPMILSGEPNSGDERECFPPSLRGEGGEGLEPIAGDLRNYADGPRDGILKVIAGLLEVGFDAIKRRDAQRRHRSALTFASAASVVAVFTSLMALYALQQRNIAETRHAQADELISFMLGDLRGRLREVGRLDLLDAVGEEAEAYFAALPPNQVEDADLEKQALALRQIGEVRLQQGKHAQAQGAFASSLEQLEALAARRPGDAGVLFERSQAEFWLGNSHYRALEFDRARPLFERYAQSAAELVALAPDNPAYRLEAAYARSNLGSLAIDQGDLDAAEAAFKAAGEIFGELAQRQPDDADLRFEVAANDSWLAAVLERRFEWAAAVEYRRAAAAAHATVTRSTGHPFHKRMDAAASMRQARAEFALGRTGDARAAQHRAIELYAELAGQDADNLDWQVMWHAAQAREALLDHFAAPGEVQMPVPGLASFEQALAITMNNPDNAQWAGQAVSAGLNVATQALLEGRASEARGILARVRPLIEANVSAAPDDLVSARHLYEASVLEHLLGGEPAHAAYALLRERPAHARANLDLAALMARLAGDADTAAALEQDLARAGFASPVYQSLRNLAGA